MSRTKKNKPAPGKEYWGKRPLGMGGQGTKEKRIGIKKERAKLKAQVKKEK